MSAPIISFTDSASAYVTQFSFGIVGAGTVSNPPLSGIVWNNFQGITSVSDAISATMTALTLSGLITGDTISDGQQIVTDLMTEIKVDSLSETVFTPIGGQVSHVIGSAAGGPGVLLGSVNGDGAAFELVLNVPSNATPTTANWLLRINYIYE